MLHRHVLVAPVQARAEPADPGCRTPTAGDTEALARLIHEAGQGSIDDQGESLEETRAVVTQYAQGGFGSPLWTVSEVNECGGRIVSAVLLSLWWGGPFVAFVATAPGWRRRGLAGAALRRVIDRLAAGGEPVLRLVVTEGNGPALGLYEGLGFKPEARRPFASR